MVQVRHSRSKRDLLLNCGSRRLRHQLGPRPKPLCGLPCWRKERAFCCGDVQPSERGRSPQAAAGRHWQQRQQRVEQLYRFGGKDAGCRTGFAKVLRRVKAHRMCWENMHSNVQLFARSLSCWCPSRLHTLAGDPFACLPTALCSESFLPSDRCPSNNQRQVGGRVRRSMQRRRTM